MDFRKVFDSIPVEFDKWRPRYCDELFADLIEYSSLGPGKTVLEIGPGTGQATEPVLKSGCSYLAIELGKSLTEFMKEKFFQYKNFSIVNADFESYDFNNMRYDLVYSAAAIQWIPEKIAFPKVNDILKTGGTLAMMMTRSEYKTPNEKLYESIQQVYRNYFYPEHEYTCSMDYNNAEIYGFSRPECRQYHKTREFNADDYISLIATHSDHIMLSEPDKTNFYKGIRDAIISFGNRIVLKDTIVLYLTSKN